MRQRYLLLTLAFLSASCAPTADAPLAPGLSADVAGPANAGDLDPAFGTGGKVTTDFFGNDDEAFGVALQPDGKIILAGLAARLAAVPHPAPENDDDFALARYNSDGSLDATFGSGGLVTTDFFGRIHQTLVFPGEPENRFPTDIAFQVLLQPTDHKIVLAGWAFDESTGFHFALARYNTNGTLDATFGNGGKVTSDFTGKFDAVLAAALQPDGKIVVAGTWGHPSQDGEEAAVDFGLARYNANGTLDASFGSGGLVTTDFLGGIDEARAVTVQLDGKIVVAGFAAPPGLAPRGFTAGDFALARYTADGSLDAGFGVGGKVTTDFFGSFDAALGLILLPDGKIVAAGRAFHPGKGRDFALARYNANGSLDATFGTGGLVTTDFSGGLDQVRAVALQLDGKIVAAGWASDADFAVARYNADGSLDASFGVGGKVTTDFLGSVDHANAVALQPDGKIVAAGFAVDPARNAADFALARYLGDSRP